MSAAAPAPCLAEDGLSQHDHAQPGASETAAAPSKAAPVADGTGAAAPAATAGAAEEHSQLQMRLAGYYIGALTSNLICLGDRLGLFAALKQCGSCTAGELARHMHLNERYIAEWLRQQASAQVISTDEAAEKYWLTPVQQDCLVHELGSEASPHFFIGGFTAVPGLAKVADERLPACFKDGTGISYNEIDHSTTCGTCRELAVWVRHALVPSLRRLPVTAAQLERGCMMADVGCGCGVALMAVAAAFPASTCHGYDISEEALREARAEADKRGLTNVQFFNPGLDDEKLPQEGTYQLVMTHDAIHDMAHPRRVMPAVRKAVADDGCWIIGDMNSLDSHGANVHNHPLAAFLYGFSCHLCLPSGLSAPEGEGLGTLGISADAMCGMLKDAGFGSAEVLEGWAHPLNRYYIGKP